MSANQHTRAATTRDLPFLLSLARKYSNEIGFIPATAVEKYIENGWVQMATENDADAGYVLARPPSRREPHIARIIQTAVSFDAQRRAHGMELVERVAQTAVVAGATILQACVRRDIEANAFFLAAGFTAVAMRSAPTARAQAHVIWRRPLVTVEANVLAHLERPFRNQGPGGRFLAATAVEKQYTFRRPTRRELQDLHRLPEAA